jgi:hypothetical protein
LLAENKVPAVTLHKGTALCEMCAQGAFVTPAEVWPLVLFDGETGRIVVAPLPSSWPRMSITLSMDAPATHRPASGGD